MIRPSIAATIEPTTMETISLKMSLAMTEDIRPETETAVNAPTAIKPAWPKESSPEKPTTRLSDKAKTM